jgi:hypothetical protein
MPKINVYYDTRGTTKRTSRNWCVTLFTGSGATTERFETEQEARDRAAVLQELHLDESIQ